MIGTLVVEDDPTVAQAHRVFTERVEGFRVVGSVTRGADALRAVAARHVDLVLLDLRLPDIPGIEVCRALRAGGSDVDVIAVTSARDLATVRGAVSLGVTQYLLKPFSFATFRDKLLAYAEYRRRTVGGPGVPGQSDVDGALAALHGTGHRAALPKGLTEDTLSAVFAALRSAAPVSAAEVAAAAAVSVPTARRYLTYLAQARLVDRTPTYGGTGRPEFRYTVGRAPAASTSGQTGAPRPDA